MWKLVIEDDEGKRTVVPLARDDYTIGRQEGNTIRLTERNVSRHHGRVRRSRGANGSSKDLFVLEDLRSYNGVFVNGLRVAHTQDLQHGDLIQIGDYRIVLQDDAASAIETAAIPVTATEPDAKATIPMASSFRGQAMTERPNRLVMLVGPTPGVEYPLDRERMTIGRAEDASISVNHNSVSRLHCEVHALGDGRFEIVDKGSSNGVRVNAAELKRSIIEAGDIIELGDVRFKFVGAGQIFVPGPNESQQLTAISDRDAELADPKGRGLAGYLIPIGAAVLVGFAIIIGFVWMKARNAANETPDAAVAGDSEQALVAEAKKNCTVEDCERSHAALATLPESSQWREGADFHQVEAMWAESILRKAKAEADPAVKKTLLERLLAPNLKIEPNQRRQASELYNAILDPAVPITDLAAKDAGGPPVATHLPPPTPKEPREPKEPRPGPTSHTTVTNATTGAPATAPAPAPTAKVNNLEKAREAGARGDFAEVRRLLETKVKGGHGSPDEVKLVKEACRLMGDRSCVDEVKAKYQ